MAEGLHVDGCVYSACPLQWCASIEARGWSGRDGMEMIIGSASWAVPVATPADEGCPFVSNHELVLEDE